MSESRANDFEFDPKLLDLHLGHLSTAEQAELRRLIAAEPRLAAQEEALSAVFDALRSAQQEPLPGDLATRVSARIQAAGPPPHILRASDAVTDAVERKPERVLRLGNLRDIVAVAAMIVLAVGVGVPGLIHVRDRQQRMGCSWNLAQVGRGLQQYASTFNAALPFAGWSPGGNSWSPSSDPNIETIPNRRHVYPVLRLAYVRDPRLFVCPSQRGVPMPTEAIEHHNDFLEGRNVTYAYQNMAGVRPSTNDDQRLPIMADENPLFDDGLPLLDFHRLPWENSAELNSSAHNRAGQNILTLDGRVVWAPTPCAGVNGDNIWTLDNVTDYTGREGPVTTTDSHLLK